MGDANPIRTLGDYSKPSHEGYRIPLSSHGSHDTRYCMEDLERAFVEYASLCTDEAREGLVSNFMASQDARLSKFEADFQQQQSKMTNKIDTVLKAITDQMAGALPSDTVKNPKLNVKTTTLVLFAHKPATTWDGEQNTEEAKSPVTKNVNSISLARGEEERNNDNDVATGDDIEKPTRTEMRMPVKEAEKENEAQNGIKNEQIRKAGKEEMTEAPSSQPVEYYLKHRINEKLIEGLVDNHRFNESLSGARDVLVEVAEHVYPVDFMIFDIKEDENRPFILGTPFLTTAKAMIKFNKGTITLRSGKSKISFHMIPKSLCKSGKGIKNDIEPIAPTMTVNRLVLEWEEKIKLQQEKEMEFDRWRNKNFKNERPAPVKIVDEMDDEGEVT
ncbi:zinc finger, CCHC-type containing protein [Tanacetum coccineum]